jgi:D-lactate dehydrogenase
MQILGVDIVHRRKDIQYVTLAQGLRQADIIFCAAPLTNKTRGTINRHRLILNKKKPIIVNIARGEITPLAQMKQLLQRGQIGGLGLDVFPEEEVLAGALRSNGQGKKQLVKIILELNKYDNVIFTPHNAFNSVEALERKARQTMGALEHFLKTGKFVSEIRTEE